MFQVIGRRIDRIEFLFSNLVGDVDALIKQSQSRGPWRRHLAGTAATMSAGVSSSPRSRSFWFEVGTSIESWPAAFFAELIARSTLDGYAYITSSDEPTVRRMDLATDVLFGDASDAQRILLALSSIPVPRHRMVVHYRVGSRAVETVSWTTQDGIKLRVYDRTARSGEYAAGVILRFEHQHRPRARDRETLTALRDVDLSQLAHKPLASGDLDGFVVSDLAGVNDRLLALRDIGHLSDRESERLLGTLVRMHTMGPTSWLSGRTASKRAGELRRAGLALDVQLSRLVDLGPVLAAVRDAWKPGSFVLRKDTSGAPQQ